MNRHWVLLRGLGRDKRHWGSFILKFQQAFKNDRVSAIDTCGNGNFAQQKSPLSILEYTEHCRQQLHGDNVYKNKQIKVHLVALSLGGMIAVDWAQRFPDEVLSLTLINSSIANFTPWHKRINLLVFARLLKTILSKKSSEELEKSILQVSSNFPIQQSTLDCWHKYRCTQGTSFVNLIRQLIAAARFKANKLPNIVPLVLSSKEDRLVSYIASEDIHRYLGGQLIIHPKAGHDLPLDDGDWVIQQIKRSSTCHKVVI